MQAFEAYIKYKRIKLIKIYSEKDVKNRREISEIHRELLFLMKTSKKYNTTEIAIKTPKEVTFHRLKR